MHKPYEHTCTACPQVARCQCIAVHCPRRQSHPAGPGGRLQPSASLSISPLDELWPPYRTLQSSVCLSPGGIWTELCQTSLFFYSEIKYLLGTICTHSWGGRRSSQPWNSGSGLLQSFQTLRILGTQQSCMVEPGLARPTGMPMSWLKACLLYSVCLSQSHCSSTSHSLSLSLLFSLWQPLKW